MSRRYVRTGDGGLIDVSEVIYTERLPARNGGGEEWVVCVQVDNKTLDLHVTTADHERIVECLWDQTWNPEGVPAGAVKEWSKLTPEEKLRALGVSVLGESALLAGERLAAKAKAPENQWKPEDLAKHAEAIHDAADAHEPILPDKSVDTSQLEFVTVRAFALRLENIINQFEGGRPWSPKHIVLEARVAKVMIHVGLALRAMRKILHSL